MSVLKHIVTEVYFEGIPGCSIDECAKKSIISKYYLGLK